MYINNNFSSPSHATREKKIEYIILHYTELTFDEALAKLIDEQSQVSAHYLIKENGQVFRLVSDDKIAWHAGDSAWKKSTKLNQNSIGIEIDNLGKGDFSSAQMLACIDLCHSLVAKHDLNPANIIGHSDVAPDRKLDPGIFFNWSLLAKNGLGMQHNLTYSDSAAKEILFEFNQKNAGISKLQKNLNKLGYKIEPTGELDIQTSSVIRAFQGRFCPQVIKAKGGIDFYRNLASQYNWDAFSQRVLEKLLQS